MIEQCSPMCMTDQELADVMGEMEEVRNWTGDMKAEEFLDLLKSEYFKRHPDATDQDRWDAICA